MVTGKGGAIKTLRTMTEEERKLLLGDDFATYTAFMEKQDAKALVSRAKDLATDMISGADKERGTKDGKFFAEYARIEAQVEKMNKQLDAIWQKALDEAEAEVGIVKADKE